VTAARDGRVALDPAGRQAGERRRLQVVDPGMFHLVTRLPRCHACVGRSALRRPTGPHAAPLRRLVGPAAQPASSPDRGRCRHRDSRRRAPRTGVTPPERCHERGRRGNRRRTTESHGRPVEIRDVHRNRALPRDGRVALDPAGRQAGERRRLQVVDPGMSALSS
jgi:hypothetical protein